MESVDQETTQEGKRINIDKLFSMIGKRDWEIERLADENKNMLKQIQELQKKNQDLYDENIKLGGGTSHASNNG